MAWRSPGEAALAIRVGLVDSGVSEMQMHLVMGQKDFVGSGAIIDRLGHGAAIVERLLSSGTEFELCVARVFADQLVCTVDQCAEAINWLIAQKPIFINLSFGLRRDSEGLQAACAAAVASDVGLVAASPAQGDAVYPAAYPGVVRATGDARCASTEVAWLGSQQADVAGYVGDPATGHAGASIGCASVSARLLRMIENNPGSEFGGLVRQLEAEAEYHGAERKQ